MTALEAQEATLDWVRRVVIGLGLCPFAGPAFAADRLRVRVCTDETPAQWLEAVADEARALVAADPSRVETVLLVLPRAAEDFESFNDLLDPVEDLLETLGLDDAVQTAIFHPGFRFAGMDDDDPRHGIHRAPLPTLHLLRRESLEAVDEEEVAAILERNARTMGSLGPTGWREPWRDRS